MYEEIMKLKPAPPNYSFYDYLEIFPEAKGVAKRELLNQLKFLRKQLSELQERYEAYYDNVINKANFQDQSDLIEMRKIIFTPKFELFQKEIKRKQFYLSSIKERPVESKGITSQQIARAREVPISNFYNDPKKLCPFHQEKTGSFTIYPKQNRWWCYGCNIGGDVIDFIMRQQNLSFVQAIKLLIR